MKDNPERGDQIESEKVKIDVRERSCLNEPEKE
jgi:hypothetical protein